MGVGSVSSRLISWLSHESQPLAKSSAKKLMSFGQALAPVPAVDSAFDSGETLLLLQERQFAYALPLRRKGSGRNPRNDCFEGTVLQSGALRSACPARRRQRAWIGL